MTIRKTKKVRRYRGHRTHGGGAAKKRRGAGSRGGRGMAGSGKRADQKKPTIIKLYGTKYFGKKGFVNKNPRKVKAVNISYIEKNLSNFEKKGDSYIVNLKEFGINKLLGMGKAEDKLIVTVELASKSAVEKIKKIGGYVILNNDN